MNMKIDEQYTAWHDIPADAAKFVIDNSLPLYITSSWNDANGEYAAYAGINLTDEGKRAAFEDGARLFNSFWKSDIGYADDRKDANSYMDWYCQGMRKLYPGLLIGFGYV